MLTHRTNHVINVLLPLLIISAYNSSGIKKIVGIIEICIMLLFLYTFPATYNFFMYKSTSRYDYVCMISSLPVLPVFLYFYFQGGIVDFAGYNC
ncbi:hypothetical protein C1645_761149 [Glomus cerebriforme]|uniref:Uncharacterized protein n=1 Tax=Glomus cerebriforme TaxID=658196 RepID=A0A397TG12_9GLOM|nr:hypothetical protein C1645_761149 [Glomus cerebriforme]